MPPRCRLSAKPSGPRPSGHGARDAWAQRRSCTAVSVCRHSAPNHSASTSCSPARHRCPGEQVTIRCAHTGPGPVRGLRTYECRVADAPCGAPSRTSSASDAAGTGVLACSSSAANRTRSREAGTGTCTPASPATISGPGTPGLTAPSPATCRATGCHRDAPEIAHPVPSLGPIVGEPSARRRRRPRLRVRATPPRPLGQGVSAPAEGDVNMKQRSRLMGRRIGAAAALATVTTFGGMALAPAAFADSTVASATTHSATPSAVTAPATAIQCFNWLVFYDYKVTVPRGIACEVAARAFPTHEIAYLACVLAMHVTGVTAPVAEIVCGIASVPG